ncbi:two-component system, sensor histidine kinase RegB [uncultured Thiomicrorhabdus sp.]
MFKIQLPKQGQLRYFTSMVLFLSITWLVTLSWFIGHLQMQLSFGWVLSSYALLLLTLLGSFALMNRDKENLNPEPRNNGFWMIMLMWVMLVNSALLYQTGGTINPLIHLLLLPLALGMLLLSPPFFMSLAVVSALLYIALNYFYVPIMSLKVQSLQAFFAWHLHGSMLVFMLLVLFLALFILPMKSRLDKQQNLLEKQQRNALETEYFLSVASIASASAHQLSTPLNTLTFLHDLLQSEVKSEAGKDYLQTMQEQLQVCTHALQNLRVRADNANSTQSRRITLPQFLKDLKQEFALLHPQSTLSVVSEQQSAGNICLKADPSFKLALMNLLDNAARYSPQFVELQWQISQPGSAPQLHLRIRDQGSGLSAENLALLGKAPAESKHGLGMGVFLSRMILQRFNGELQFKNYVDNQQLPLGLEVNIVLNNIIEQSREDT